MISSLDLDQADPHSWGWSALGPVSKLTPSNYDFICGGLSTKEVRDRMSNSYRFVLRIFDLARTIYVLIRNLDHRYLLGRQQYRVYVSLQIISILCNTLQTHNPSQL